MNNYSGEPGRRVVTDASGLNRFLTRMYSNMALAVLVSALSAYLTMTVFASQVLGFFGAYPAMVWIILLLPIALSMGITFSATRNPAGGFVMLMLISIVYGVEFALIAGVYTGTNIAAAFVSSAAVFVTMAIYGTATKRDLTTFGSHATAALVALMIAWIINMFLQSPAITYIFSFIAVIIFVVLTAWDAQKMKQIYINYSDQNSMTGLAIVGALQLYLDFVNLFISFLQIFGMSDRD
ncbi:Bax inhibitor-1/YccA family protein [Limosilactobacillus kribbianus]|uniref:Bax inhibitor-1/YccA family protein n=1 Tax=Limosilactobacillus kribbianus TaxID=2982695 RepID=UPI002264558D|nr:Bax inhibitor-1/YccA family protein [Limosilactobacillus kribbianus]